MRRFIAPLLVLPFALSTAFAQDGAASSIKISGFGTGALTWTDTDDAQYVRANQASGAGKHVRTGVDSNLGLQIDARINDWFSLTAQGLVHKAGEDSYGADATLAFAKLRVSDNLSLRAGRVGLPIFMISDYRHVGYANIMLRPPQEMYNLIPINSLDGADATWQQSLGDTTLTAQLAYGRTEEKAAGGNTTIVITNQRVVNVSAEHGPFTVRVSRSDAKFSAEVGDFATPKAKVSFTSAGAAMDWNNIVLQSEYGQTRGGSAPGKNAWYLMGGYRVGKFVPFYSHGRVTGGISQTTDSVGLRWDAFRSAALKFQVDRVRPQGSGMFVNVKPGFDGPVTVGAVSVDFVF
ncbi:MAG TPA: hypothetical protein VF774_08145 [Pseudoduganella sp.]